MAITIPNPVNLDRRVVSGNFAVSSPTSYGADPSVGAGERHMGDALGQVSSDAMKYQERVWRSEVAEADAAMGVATYEQANAYNEDPDYGTIVDRFDKSTSKSLGDISAGISNPQLRDEFVAKHNESLAANRVRMQQLSFGKKKDFKRGEYNNQLESLREVVLNGNSEEVTDARYDAEELIQSGVELGYYGNEEASKMFKNWQDNAAVGRVKVLAARDPESAVKMLKGKFGKNLPSDVRVPLIEQFEDDVRDVRALKTVQGFKDKGMNSTQASFAADAIVDSEERELVQQRVTTEYARIYREEARQQDAIMDDKFNQVLLDGMKIKDFRDDYNLLTPGMQAQLKAAEDAYTKDGGTSFYPKKSDPVVVDELNELLLDPKNSIKARKYFLDNRNRLTETNNMMYSKASLEGVMPPEYKPLLTNLQFIKNALIRTDANNGDNVAAVQDEYSAWYQDYLAIKKEIPTDKLREDKISQLVESYDSSPGTAFNPLNWGGNKQVFETPGMLSLEMVKEEDPAGYARLMRIATENKITDHRDIVDTYKRMMGY